MGVLDELTVESRFHAAVHELAALAWRDGLAMEALLALAELVDPLPRPALLPELTR